MNVTTEYLFSRNKKIGSKVIRFGTRFLQKNKTLQTPSHVALLIQGRWVIEAVVEGGFRVIPLSQWLQINELLYCAPIATSYTMAQIKALFQPLKHKKYDYLGAVYFSYRILLYATLRLQLPTKNRLNSSNRYFCTEAVSSLEGIDNQMVAPIQLLEKCQTYSSRCD